MPYTLVVDQPIDSGSVDVWRAFPLTTPPNAIQAFAYYLPTNPPRETYTRFGFIRFYAVLGGGVVAGVSRDLAAPPRGVPQMVTAIDAGGLDGSLFSSPELQGFGIAVSIARYIGPGQFQVFAYSPP